MYVNIKDMEGKVISSITGLGQYSRKIKFHMTDGTIYVMYHEQDCCECVELVDYCGAEEDVVGGLILSCEESTSDDVIGEYARDDSNMWTFYIINTTKGSLWLRWLGSSNGYYGVGVDIKKYGQEGQE